MSAELEHVPLSAVAPALRRWSKSSAEPAGRITRLDLIRLHSVPVVLLLFALTALGLSAPYVLASWNVTHRMPGRVVSSPWAPVPAGARAPIGLDAIVQLQDGRVFSIPDVPERLGPGASIVLLCDASLTGCQTAEGQRKNKIWVFIGLGFLVFALYRLRKSEAVLRTYYGDDLSAGTGAWAATHRPHPLRRLLARWLDIQIFGTAGFFIVTQIAMLVSPPATRAAMAWLFSGWHQMFAAIATCAIASVPLAFMTCVTGVSPGKWLFGVRVARGAGQPIELDQAIRREGMILVYGLGLALPFVSLLTLICSLHALAATGSTVWDAAVGSRVEYRPNGWRQYLGASVGTLGVVGCLFVIRNVTGI